MMEDGEINARRLVVELYERETGDSNSRKLMVG